VTDSTREQDGVILINCKYCNALIAFDSFAPHYTCGSCRQWFGLDITNIPFDSRETVMEKRIKEPEVANGSEMHGALSEIYILATSCVSVNASEETHRLAESVVLRILDCGYTKKPS